MLALHPFVTFPLSLAVLAFFRKHPQQPRTVNGAPEKPALREDQRSVAILLCAYNEENVIKDRIDNLLAIADTVPDSQVLVYTDASSDGTVNILKSFGSRITLIESKERHGKTHGMNTLVELTTANLIVFTDAAVRMNNDVLTKMVKYFDDPQVGCICGHIVGVSADCENQTSSTAHTSIKYWALDAIIRRLESRVASVIGAHGPLFAIRRTLHVPVPVALFDDLYLSLTILFNGHRVIQAEDVYGFKAIATCRDDEFTRKVRIACQSYNIHKILKPRLKQQTWLIRYLYAGHKTLRWLTIFSLAGAVLFATLACWFAGLYYLVYTAWSVFAIGVLLGYAGVKPFAYALDALLFFLATGLGVIQSLRGKFYQTWTSVASARKPSSAET